MSSTDRPTNNVFGETATAVQYVTGLTTGGTKAPTTGAAADATLFAVFVSCSFATVVAVFVIVPIVVVVVTSVIVTDVPTGSVPSEQLTTAPPVQVPEQVPERKTGP